MALTVKQKWCSKKQNRFWNSSKNTYPHFPPKEQDMTFKSYTASEDVLVNPVDLRRSPENRFIIVLTLEEETYQLWSNTVQMWCLDKWYHGIRGYLPDIKKLHTVFSGMWTYFKFFASHILVSDHMSSELMSWSTLINGQCLSYLSWV